MNSNCSFPAKEDESNGPCSDLNWNTGMGQKSVFPLCTDDSLSNSRNKDDNQRLALASSRGYLPHAEHLIDRWVVLLHNGLTGGLYDNDNNKGGRVTEKGCSAFSRAGVKSRAPQSVIFARGSPDQNAGANL